MHSSREESAHSCAGAANTCRIRVDMPLETVAVDCRVADKLIAVGGWRRGMLLVIYWCGVLFTGRRHGTAVCLFGGCVRRRQVRLPLTASFCACTEVPADILAALAAGSIAAGGLVLGLLLNSLGRHVRNGVIRIQPRQPRLHLADGRQIRRCKLTQSCLLHTGLPT